MFYAAIFMLLCQSGCRLHKQLFIHDGKVRTYLIHLPPQYDPRTPLPLVIVLHGGGGSGQNIEEQSSMSDKADQEGFIAVYPDGSGHFRNRLLTWNAGFCCAYAYENSVDDVGFIRQLIEKLQRRYAIDRQRIYATGISNGGIMAYRLGAELSDVIAAVAPVAASIGGKATADSSEWVIPPPDYSLSVIAFNGMLDTRVPYNGGIPTAENTRGAYSYLSVEESLSFWVQQNNCLQSADRQTSTSGNIIVDTYTGCTNSTEVVLYSIVNGGHAWPGGQKGWEGGDEPTQEISATDIMWEFFNSHPKQ
jgi:polyhydroxybutyrate depolymerase